MTDADDLVAHAHETRVVVVGGGVSGLVAALECAKVGMPVTVLEATDRVGGVLRSAELDGVTVDVGAESFAVRGGTVRALVDELGLSDAVVAPAAGGAWVAGLPGGAAAPLPRGGILGIPANPWADDVRRVIGWGGAWRAYIDRLRPPMTIGHQRSLGALVRSRMGDAVLDRLVAPVTTGVYSALPDDIDVDLAAPGLNNALTRAGSLAGAVGQLRGDRTEAPGSAVAGLEGGMARLVDALRTRLEELDVEIVTGAPVERIVRAGTGWTVATAASAPSDADTTTADVSTDTATTSWKADVVIVATTEGDARRLLAPVVPDLEQDASVAPVVEVITLVIDSQELDSYPRGTGVLTVPGTHTAKALTHSSAKWEWVRRATPHHIVRLSFGAQGEAPATEAMDDADAAALALAEAAALLGVTLVPAQLRAAHRERYVQSQPAATIGRAAVSAAARASIRAVPGLAAVGAWLSGTGLAQVVPDAIAESERVRRGALFGGDSATD